MHGGSHTKMPRRPVCNDIREVPMEALRRRFQRFWREGHELANGCREIRRQQGERVYLQTSFSGVRRFRVCHLTSLPFHPYRRERA